MPTKTIAPRSLLALCLAASLFSLALAFVAQYSFGLAPCHLCYAQRVPFALVTLLALWGLGKKENRLRLLYIIAALFLIGGGIAIYHSGVEQHLVSGPSGCTFGDAPANQSTEDFLKRIQGAPVVACDQPAWEWHGVTMAVLNAVWSLALAIFVFFSTRSLARQHADA